MENPLSKKYVFQNCNFLMNTRNKHFNGEKS